MSPGWEKPSIFLYVDFDVSALCRRATRLRGRPCDCDESQTPLTGSHNWAITISFNDGVEWLLRSPRIKDGAIKCHKINSDLLASEAATLKYIKANSSIPVPEVFAYRDNEIGIPYILMSKAAGFPLSHRWESMSHQDKKKILYQLGSITLRLSKLRFSQIGSLIEDDSGLQIGPCLCRGLVTYYRHELEDINRGPYLTMDSYFSALFTAFTEHARFLYTTPHCFVAPVPLMNEFAEFSQYRAGCNRWSDFTTLGSKFDCSQNRLDYVIAGDILSEILAEWQKNTPSALPQNFCLQHPDLSVNNIFIDDQYNVTCLIDWSFASTVPLSVLLTAPGLPQSRNELAEPLVLAFQEGFKAAASNTSQDKDLLEYQALYRTLQCSRPMWLICRLLDFDSLEDFNLFRELWRLIGPKDKKIVDVFRIKQAMPHYRLLYMEMKEEDQSEEQNSRFEDQYFKGRSELEISISKKLTLVSEWYPRYDEPSSQIRHSGDVFVADRKLWRWIEVWLEDYRRYIE